MVKDVEDVSHLFVVIVICGVRLDMIEYQNKSFLCINFLVICSTTEDSLSQINNQVSDVAVELKVLSVTGSTKMWRDNRRKMHQNNALENRDHTFWSGPFELHRSLRPPF